MAKAVLVTFAIYHAKLGPNLQTTSEASLIYPIARSMPLSSTRYKSTVIEATVALLCILPLPPTMLFMQAQ